MLKKYVNIVFAIILIFGGSCQTNNRATVSKRTKPEETRSGDEYNSDQVDKLLEKQQKNKTKKDKYEDKRRAQEVKQIEKDAKNGNTEKGKKKKKKLNDGEFKFY
jgi:hypothetical protein